MRESWLNEKIVCLYRDAWLSKRWAARLEMDGYLRNGWLSEKRMVKFRGFVKDGYRSKIMVA